MLAAFVRWACRWRSFAATRRVVDVKSLWHIRMTARVRLQERCDRRGRSSAAGGNTRDVAWMALRLWIAFYHGLVAGEGPSVPTLVRANVRRAGPRGPAPANIGDVGHCTLPESAAWRGSFATRAVPLGDAESKKGLRAPTGPVESRGPVALSGAERVRSRWRHRECNRSRLSVVRFARATTWRGATFACRLQSPKSRRGVCCGSARLGGGAERRVVVSVLVCVRLALSVATLTRWPRSAFLAVSTLSSRARWLQERACGADVPGCRSRRILQLWATTVCEAETLSKCRWPIDSTTSACGNPARCRRSFIAGTSSPLPDHPPPWRHGDTGVPSTAENECSRTGPDHPDPTEGPITRWETTVLSGASDR